MASHVIRTLGELGEDLTLAPERFHAAALSTPRGRAHGVRLGELVVERIERLLPGEVARFVVLDTTHAKDGVLDVVSAARAATPSRSAKKRVEPGDLLVSRLRPYLRQIALAHDALWNAHNGTHLALACSTEFYVLAPRAKEESLAYLLPFLLSEETQAVLAAGQEGGHHPRVPRETLFALRVPEALVRARRVESALVERRLADLYRARGRLDDALRPQAVRRPERGEVPTPETINK